MKYCSQCGSQFADDVAVCTNCGASLEVAQAEVVQAEPAPASALTTLAKVFMIIGTVASGMCIIPLAWCLPMTISYFKKIKENKPVSVGFKVCTLLFVSVLAGIFMLCDKDN